MTFGQHNQLRRRLLPLLLAALFAHTSAHAYFHLGDAPLAHGDAHLSEPSEGRTIYSSPHQCFVCQSLQTQPLDRAAEFVFAPQTDATILRPRTPFRLSSPAADLQAARAPPRA
jgi:hypothetical protein